MSWQTHYLGHALSPPPTGRDVSENTQVESVLPEHGFYPTPASDLGLRDFNLCINTNQLECGKH